MKNLQKHSKDMYLKKEDTQPVTNPTTLSKKEELMTLQDKYKKGSIGRLWRLKV